MEQAGFGAPSHPVLQRLLISPNSDQTPLPFNWLNGLGSGQEEDGERTVRQGHLSGAFFLSIPSKQMEICPLSSSVTRCHPLVV